MRICHLSATPVAGACWSWSEAFKEAGYDSWCCCPPGYDGGRTMPRDEDFPPSDREIQMIWNSDLVFVYQGWPYLQPWYPKSKPTVALYVSQPHHVRTHAAEDGWPWAVIGEYQTRLYPGCEIVPNLIPLKHPWFQPGHKLDDGRLRIMYSPSNKGLTGWDDKGYDHTVQAMGYVGHDCDLDVCMNASLEDCLYRKGTAHIVIDECVTGSYHGNSLQGLAAGCVVINAADTKALANMKKFAGVNVPFEYTPLSLLEGRLKLWNVRGPAAAAEKGAENRAWLDEHYQPKKLIENWFAPLMSEAVAKAGAV